MRVAVFTDNDFNKVNGVTTTLTALLAHRPVDVQPRIYTATDLGTDHPDYLALPSRSAPIPFYGEMRMYLPHWREYLRRVRGDGIELLHLTTPGPMGLTALWVARQTGLPLVGSFHTDLATYTTILSGSPRLGCWMGKYMRWIYAKCERVLVPSRATREALADSIADERLVIWPRGVDTELFTPARRSPALRYQWRASDEHPVLLYVGRLSREKGLDQLPGIVDRLRALGLICRLVIAGEGPLRRWLADRCPEAIFTGVLGREAVAEVFASADLFVFPSRTDTAGNVVLEAQASGLPVVVAGAGGPRENVVAGVTGLVCERSDAVHWGATLAMLVRDAEQRRAMAAAATRYAATRRWDRSLLPLFDTYRAVIRQTPGTREPAHHAA